MDDERVLGVVDRLKTVGPRGHARDVVTLVVTDRRWIVAFQTDAIVRAATDAADARARAAGKWIFGRTAAKLNAIGDLPKRLLAMTPRAILAESPGNYAVAREGGSADVHHRMVSEEGGDTFNDYILTLSDGAGERRLVSDRDPGPLIAALT